MVLESLLSPENAERKPWELLFIGIIYTTIAIFLALWIFSDQASLVTVFLIVLASIPLVYRTMRYEESKDLVITKESSLLREHNKAVVFLMFLFLGFTLASVLWYVVLPVNLTSILFEKQTSTIQAINNQVSGRVTGSMAVYNKIFLNNLKVLSFSVIFSFIYSTGAIFILAWNATVIGAAIGNFIRNNLSYYTSSLGYASVGNYLHIISLGLLKYAVHGIPEIMAYFYGGLAGGILSIAIIRKHYKSDIFNHIMADFFEMLLLSVAFLIVAAFLEVFVTPILF